MRARVDPLRRGSAGEPSRADEWLWTYIECEAEEQEVVRVVTALIGDEAGSMSEEQFDAVIDRASRAGQVGRAVSAQHVRFP